MIRENRRPLLAFALVATICAATLVQGVRSEALQGFVASQVPQVVVSGARLVPAGAADLAPAAAYPKDHPPASVPSTPGSAADAEPPVPSAPASPRGEGRPESTDQAEDGARPQREHTRPPGHAHGLTRPDRAPGQRSHTGGHRHRSDPPHRHDRRAEGKGRTKARPSDGARHRVPAGGHGTAQDKVRDKGKGPVEGSDAAPGED